MKLALDASKSSRAKGFEFSRRAEEAYARQLRKIARHIGDIVRGITPDGVIDADTQFRIDSAMRSYSDVLEPWATNVGSRMLTDVDRRDARSWASYSEQIGKALKREIDNAPTGQALRERLADQVTLIKSLPTDAAARVHELALKGLSEGRRSSEIAAEIMRTGEVSASRATTIARTEVARTSSLLTQVRAQSIGCTHFTWMTSKDAQVRPSHRKMSGVICEFAKPPIVDGAPLIPGQTFNCRCWIKPVLPD